VLRSTLLGLAALLVCPNTQCQSVPPESGTLQALLTEVHQLRVELETVATSARRAQILIYRLYMQQAIVTRASDNFESAKAEFEQVESRRQYDAAQIKQFEDLRDKAENAERREQFENTIAQLRSQRELTAAAGQQIEMKMRDFELQLRIEREKLEREEAELEQIDSVLTTSVEQQNRSTK
jgi:chromosome segregation ATPase